VAPDCRTFGAVTRGHRREERRARIALALCLVWIVGFELGPWLHVALHDHLAPHHHTAFGEVVDDHDRDAEVDEHGASVHDHDRAAAPHTITDADAHLLAALAHGAHSLEHHGVAVPPPAPPVLHPLPIDRRPTFVAAVVAIAPLATPVARALARGPPSSLTSHS